MASGAGRCPLRIAAGQRLTGTACGLGTRRPGPLIGEHIIEIGIEARFDGLLAFEPVRHPVGTGAFRLPGGRSLGCLALRFGLAGTRGLLRGRPFQQRIALQLAFYISCQIMVGQLQQLDGLHQLRRHHERLGLSKQKSLCESHTEHARLVYFLLIWLAGVCT
jgi:hypothetical protein